MQQSIGNYVNYRMTVEAFKLTYAPTLYPIPDYDKPEVRFCPVYLKVCPSLHTICPP